MELTLAASDADATIIVFHGNAAHNWEDMESAEDFFNMKCNVLLASYRGSVLYLLPDVLHNFENKIAMEIRYSLSGGSPTEKGLRKTCDVACEQEANFIKFRSPNRCSDDIRLCH